MKSAAHRFDNAKRRRPADHDRQRQLTPAYILEPCRKALGGISLDPCTEPDNPTRARWFYTGSGCGGDGATADWMGSVFCNPPYGEARARWVKRCIVHGQYFPTILLIPAHTETKIVQKALEACDWAVFINARVRYALVRENGRKEAASHGSVLIGWHCAPGPVADLGVYVRPSVGLGS